MSIAICKPCNHPFNSSFCPKCGKGMSFDEYFPIDWEDSEEKEAAQEAKFPVAKAWLEQVERRKYGPLSHDAIHFITTDVKRCIEWCEESSEAKELRETLEKALVLVGKIQRNRPV